MREAIAGLFADPTPRSALAAGDDAGRDIGGVREPGTDSGVHERELFGCFGDRDAFDALAGHRPFDVVLEGDGVTVGVRSPDLDVPNRTSVAETDAGCAAVWGEAFTPDDASHGASTAHWLLDAVGLHGLDALDALNGSYLAVVEHDGDAFVATDPARSWTCYYTDDPGVRAFGTDATAVARTVANPSPDVDAIREFLHLGVALGEKTAVDEVARAPLDAVVRAADVHELDRFVHDEPAPNAPEAGVVDWVDELAARLERAISRRAGYPGRSGVMLSAGYDSRILCSQLPDVDVAYTVGHPAAQETAGARAVAEQYDADHVGLEPAERYVAPHDAKVRYSQGIKESLHIHHAGYSDEMTADTIYHGLLCDTFLTGHFLEPDYVEGFGKRLPRDRLDPDPDPVQALLDRFGFVADGSEALAEHTALAGDDPVGFVRDAIRTELDAVGERATHVQNRIDVAGMRNQPSIPFRRHLFDNYRESFFVLDAELVDWHLAAPPAVRNTQTFLDACRQLDPAILDNRPPDRPHDSRTRNEIEGFLRRVTPLVPSFESAWPDRRDIYDANDLDDDLFPARHGVRELPVRHKLRVNDVRRWTDLATRERDHSATVGDRPPVATD